MKKWVMILGLSLAITVLLAFAACGANGDTTYANNNGLSVQQDDGGILHQFSNPGFSVVFPAAWEGKYGLVEHHFDDWGTIIEVYHTATRETIGTGWLWSFRRVHEDDFMYDGQPSPLNHAIMYQGGGYAFIMMMPTDVQWDYARPDGDLAAEYLKMADQWEEIANSFRLLD